MKILVLAAGEGSRFANSDWRHWKKPVIPLKGKTIIKRTTDSIPIQEPYFNWYFAVQTKHDLEKNLKEIYSEDINLIEFNNLTRGNLETAYNSCMSRFNKDESLLILDSDNVYDGFGLIEKFESIEVGAAVCWFEPIDYSSKWGFAFSENGKLWRVSEKDPEALKYDGKPMVGTFFFSSVGLFESLAAKVLSLGFKEKNEFFMTQAIREALIQRIPVFSYEVKDPIPLGTPEDVEKFLKSDLP